VLGESWIRLATRCLYGLSSTQGDDDGFAMALAWIITKLLPRPVPPSGGGEGMRNGLVRANQRRARCS
jgi:hypothetical protein